MKRHSQAEYFKNMLNKESNIWHGTRKVGGSIKTFLVPS